MNEIYDLSDRVKEVLHLLIAAQDAIESAQGAIEHKATTNTDVRFAAQRIDLAGEKLHDMRLVLGQIVGALESLESDARRGTFVGIPAGAQIITRSDEK